MLIAQNPADVIIAPAVTRTYARQACAAGKTVKWIDIVGKGHPTSAQDSAAATLNWIGDRFAGKAHDERLRLNLGAAGTQAPFANNPC